MKKEEFCEVFGDISEKYVKEARADRKAKKTSSVSVESYRCLFLLAACGTVDRIRH